MATFLAILLFSSLLLVPAFSLNHDQSQVGHLSDLDHHMYLLLSQKLNNSSAIASPAAVNQLYHLINGNKPKYAAASSLSDIAKIHSLRSRNKQYKSASPIPDVIVFYRYDDFKIGSKIPSLFTNQGPSSANLLEKQHPSLRSPFNSNPQLCGSTAKVHGEQQSCVDSFDTMLKFVRGLMGKDITPLITPVGKWQEYIVNGPVRTIRHAVTTCHKLDYNPFAAYGCHYIPRSEVHVLPLKGTDGTELEAISVCHLDTSSWSPTSVVFITLNEKPGPPICHFMATDDIVWVSS